MGEGHRKEHLLFSPAVGTTRRQRATEAPLDLDLREREDEREREKEGEEGERERKEERGAAADGTRSPEGVPPARRLSHRARAEIPLYNPHASCRLQGCCEELEAPGGVAGARIWRPLFYATVPSSSFSSRDVDLQKRESNTFHSSRHPIHISVRRPLVCSIETLSLLYIGFIERE